MSLSDYISNDTRPIKLSQKEPVYHPDLKKYVFVINFETSADLDVKEYLHAGREIWVNPLPNFVDINPLVKVEMRKYLITKVIFAKSEINEVNTIVLVESDLIE